MRSCQKKKRKMEDSKLAQLLKNTRVQIQCYYYSFFIRITNKDGLGSWRQKRNFVIQLQTAKKNLLNLNIPEHRAGGLIRRQRKEHNNKTPSWIPFFQVGGRSLVYKHWENIINTKIYLYIPAFKRKKCYF